MKRRTQNSKLIQWVLLFDLCFILLHLLFSHQSSFVHLDREYNLPTVYQATKLIGVGALALMVVWQLKIQERLSKDDLIFYGLFAAGFILIGVDELGQLHENVDHFVRELVPEYANSQLELAEALGYHSSTWMLYYLPVFLLATVYFRYAARYVWNKIPTKRREFVGMVTFFTLVIIFEYASNQGQVLPHVYETYIIFEESAEMFGATAGLAIIWEMFIKNTERIKAKLQT